MVDVHIHGIDQALMDRQMAITATLYARFHGDATFRNRLETDGSAMLREIGYVLPPGIEAKVVANTPTLVHFVLPPDPNTELGDEALSVVSGGSTAGTAGSLGTLSSVPGTAGCLSCAGTAGTAG